MKRIVMAITGASGAVYARRLAQELLAAKVELHVVISPNGRRVLADELDLKKFSLEGLVEGEAAGATLHPHNDVGATIASGSFLTQGMVVCPCSSNTLGAIAVGVGDNLVTRAAMVTLKEGRRLVLVPREMPLSAIELEGMLRLSRAGVVICPACPGFYMRPTGVGELVDFVVGRVLDLLGVEHRLNVRWKPRAD